MEKWGLLHITSKYQNEPPLIPQETRNINIFPVLREQHHSGVQHFINYGSYTSSRWSLSTVALCCVTVESLNPGWALSCVWVNRCSQYVFFIFPPQPKDIYARLLEDILVCALLIIQLIPPTTPQSETARQIWTVYRNLECCDSQSFTENWPFTLDLLWKTASNACAAVTCRKTGVLIQCVCDRPRYSVTNTQSCVCARLLPTRETV